VPKPLEASLEHPSPAVDAALASRLFGALFDLMHRFQRKNGYVFSAWGELSLVEHHILIELDQKIPRRPSDLEVRVNFPISQLNHTLDSLEQRKLVRFVPGDTKREKLVLITPAGREVVVKLDDISNHLMNLLAEAGTTEQQRKMYSFWETLNNALSAPRSVARPGDHPFRLQSRRYTRVLGYFSRKCAESDLGYPDLQILFCLQESGAGLSLGTLSELLLVPRATLKARIRKLFERGLCSEPSERKGALIGPSASTAAAIDEVRQGYCQFLSQSIKPSAIDPLMQSIEACAAMIHEWQPDYRPQYAQGYALPKETIFLALQVQVLSDFARQQFGILQPSLPAELPKGTFIVVLFDGPTPCFSLRVRQIGWDGSEEQRFLFEEFGYSERIDWESASLRVVETLRWASLQSIPEGTWLRARLHEPLPELSLTSPSNHLPVRLDQRAEPLRDLLSIRFEP
jgi:DNA-binding MarR family transcriptional regulator